MDFIRGISALLVCASHLRAVMFIDGSQLEHTSILEKLFYFSTSLGHSAVMIFFVLSGFFVGGAVLKKGEQFNFRQYLVARLSRLWTPLIPALLFTLLIDQAIRVVDPSILLGAHNGVINSGPTSLSYSASALTFIANTAFVQTIFSPVYGTNGPLWSLAYEFWYYLLFPILVIILGLVPASKPKRVMLALLFLALSMFALQKLMFGFLIWLLGVGVYYAYTKNLLNFGKWFALPAFGALGVTLLDSKLHFLTPWMPNLSDLLLGIAFSFVLLSIRGMDINWQPMKYIRRFSIWLSDISYTLYIFHFPLVMLFYALYYTEGRGTLSPQSLAIFCGVFLLLILGSWGFWWVFERNTYYVRKYMETALNRFDRRTVASNDT